MKTVIMSVVKEEAMTLKEFRASKTWCNDLSKEHPAYVQDERDYKVCGFVYAGGLIIELITNAEDSFATAIGQWELILCNADYLDYDLPKLEAMLFDYATSEGMID